MRYSREQNVRILKVEARDVKGLQYAEFETNGRVSTIVGGKNENGKSSLLDAIAMCIGGPKLFPAKPIRDGAETAEIVVDVDGGATQLPWPCQIIRTIARGKSGNPWTTQKVEIIAQGGFAAPSPQKLLNEVMMKGIGFDPLEFANSSSKEQVETLKGIVGVDFSTEDARRKSLYDERTLKNREVAASKQRCNLLPHHLEVGSTDATALKAELQRRRAVNKANAQCAQDRKQREQEIGQRGVVRDNIIRSYDLRISDRMKLIEIHEQEISAIMLKIENTKVELDGLLRQKQQEQDNFDAGTGKLVLELGEVVKATQANVELDEDEIVKSIDVIAAEQAKVKDNDRYAKAMDEHDALVAQSADFTREIDAIDAVKEEAMKGIAWPVEGMGFGEFGVTLNGIPLDQISGEERITTSVAIGMRLNPEFRFVIIKEGSLLDDEHLISVVEQVAKAGGQVFIERVSEGSECHIVMENGLVKGSEKDPVVAGEAMSVATDRALLEVQGNT